MSEEPKFEVTLQGDENLQLIIRAHLQAEQLLFKIVTEGLREPSVLDLDRISFLTKSRLAVAMGLIPGDVLPPLTVLNSIRNSYAHKASYVFTDENKRDLINSVPGYVLEVMLTGSNGEVLHTRDGVPLVRVLTVLVCWLEAKRLDVVRNKKAEAEGIKRLREAIDRIDAKFPHLVKKKSS